jgi:hypothetical protein
MIGQFLKELVSPFTCPLLALGRSALFPEAFEVSPAGRANYLKRLQLKQRELNSLCMHVISSTVDGAC